MWTATVHAKVRSVGPRVYVYGPVCFLGTRNVRLGGGGNLHGGVLFETEAAGAIVIGDDFTLNRGAVLAAHAEITIGDHALIGEYVSIRDCDHAFGDPTRPMRQQGFTAAAIHIGNDVWIGRGAAILKGVTIGDGAVIAANAVVTKDIPAMEIWAGVPARFLRRRSGADAP
jgi:acetyltransferase-like isoleucine patch superfamily enzyme